MVEEAAQGRLVDESPYQERLVVLLWQDQQVIDQVGKRAIHASFDSDLIGSHRAGCILIHGASPKQSLM